MMTPRIRTVKPQLFSHEGLFEIEMKYQLPLRLAYISLFSCCDREGRFRWQPGRLKLYMLPYDKADIAQVLDIFHQHGYIQKYEHQGELIGCIPTWSRHQKIRKEAKSILPSIEEAEKVSSNFNINNQIVLEEDLAIDASPVSMSDVDHKNALWETKVDHKKVLCPAGREEKGRERKGKEEKGSIVAPKVRLSADENQQQIENVFEHWKVLMDHPNAKLDEKRKSIISKALKLGYSVADLCQAIAGCSYTPHNIGDNDRGQRYDGLHVILRDADQIDRFIRNCKFPPRPVSESDRRSQATVHNLQSWMKRTIAEEEAYANQ
jgi:hypothetical protein